VHGKWYFKGNMSKRNMDTGIGDNKVSPCIPPVKECEGVEPWDCPVPLLNYTESQGFGVKILIVPSVKKEVFRRVLGKETINDLDDFPKIMSDVEQDATRRGYSYLE
jgi:hypothetical protein